MTHSPMVTRDSAQAFARIEGTTVSVAQFCADVLNCAETLPDTPNLINLCQHRYAFTVTFFAALVRGQVNLLPPNRDRASIEQLAREVDGCSIVKDTPLAEGDALVEIRPGAHGEAHTPRFADDQLAAIAFTSGSTGAPQPHHKRWGLLAAARHVHWHYLPISDTSPRDLLATVPSWHMYGLEWALMLPTAAPVRLYCGADFYPQDVAAALRGSDHAAILISTPLHLRALSKADLPAGALEFIVSATAPIEAELVTNLEENLGARVFEVYGCSEIGSLAWRLPRETPGWEFFDCFDLRLDGDEITVDHNDLEQPVVLADRFAPCPAGGYTLEGRATDIVKVAGKRESLARLNALLTAIEGVDDGVFYRPEDFGFPARDRLAAVVVAPALSSQQVRAALALRLESTFMPRPLDVVADLPRETTSKLNHETLGALLRKLRA